MTKQDIPSNRLDRQKDCPYHVAIGSFVVCVSLGQEEKENMV
jgi:hypothetical protein